MIGVHDTRIESTKFSRLWCERCQAETIHRSSKCSCGAVHRAYPVRTLTQILRNSINLPGSRPVRRR